MAQGHALWHPDDVLPDAIAGHCADDRLTEMVRKTTPMNAYGHLAASNKLCMERFLLDQFLEHSRLFDRDLQPCRKSCL